jgi:hypothetical protein
MSTLAVENKSDTKHDIKQLKQKDKPEAPGLFFLNDNSFNNFSGAQKNNPVIQTKLTIGSPDDIYEQEADKTADKVMKMPEPVSVQRKNEEDDKLQMKPITGEIKSLVQRQDEDEEKVQTKSWLQMKSGETETNNSFENKLNTSKNSGNKLNDDTRSFMESRFGSDFSDVKVHTDNEAVKMNRELNSQAFTYGKDIFFNEEKYNTNEDAGKRLIAHELAHVVQSNNIKNSKSLTSDFSLTVRRGEAPVHRDIELTTLEVEDFTNKEYDELTPEQKAAAKVYAGNWMRDFSQFNVPKPINALAKLPKQVNIKGDPVVASGTIGAEGAQEIVYGIIRALAALEFGREITDKLITNANIGAYRPQEHIDNPAGMTLTGDVVSANISKPKKNEYAGAAVTGDQLMNPKLYLISKTGLSSHIYNSIEFVKAQFIEAMSEGATDLGRMKMGTGLHGVEDYFSHSNFIEVALNIIFSRSAEMKKLPENFNTLNNYKTGKVVDTLFDAEIQKGGVKRQAITTGTFGSTDTMVSIAEVLVPMLPNLLTIIDKAIDKAFGIVEKDSNSILWNKLEEELATDKGGASLCNLLNGIDASGMKLSSIKIKRWNIGDYWIASGYTEELTIASVALINIGQTVRDIKQTRDRIKGISSLFIPFFIKSFLDSIDEIINSIKIQIKKRIKDIILSSAQKLTGIDPKKLWKSSLQNIDQAVHNQVEELTKKSSLQSRLKNPKEFLKDEKSKVIPEVLPPSHSEISKDHPDPPAKKGEVIKGARTKSLFYDLHFKLAVHADKHIMGLMEKVWIKNSGSSILPGRYVNSDVSTFNKLKNEATFISSIESQNATTDKRNFAQLQNKNLGSEEIAVLNAVDLFMSHPANSI